VCVCVCVCVIFGKTFEEMLANLRVIFLFLRKANMKLNPKKCIFFSKKMKYLDYVGSESSISTDSEKSVESVRNWPVPLE